MTTTVAALLTPPGKSALAVIGIRGPLAWSIAQTIFTPRTGQTTLTPGRWWLGRVGVELIDEGILVVRRADPPEVEFHVHGGRAVVRLLLDLCAQHGAQVVDWEAYSGAELGDVAVLLARACTVRTANILLDQFHGAFRRDLQQARQGDERMRRALVERLPLGQRLTTSFRVVLAGAPNVGKSSLVNALAGYQRAIVSPTPGTTRDVVSTSLAIDGWPIELFDTAGLHRPSGELERAGIDQARSVLTSADLVLWLVATTESPPLLPEQTLAAPCRIVVNKIDQPPTWDLSLVEDAPRVSATTGEGLDRLVQLLSSWLVPNPPPPGAGVPCTPEQMAEVRSLSSP